MWNPSSAVAFSMRAAGPSGRVSSPTPTYWQLSRATEVVRLLTGLPHVNVLLMGIDSEMWPALEMRLMELDEPIVIWSPGRRLAFPESTQTGTLILNDVEALTHDQQRQLLEWLEPAGRCVRVISTTSVPLFTRLESGGFSETLYYRLNTVMLEIER
jgi:Sigma-54 interaction domain